MARQVLDIQESNAGNLCVSMTLSFAGLSATEAFSVLDARASDMHIDVYEIYLEHR